MNYKPIILVAGEPNSIFTYTYYWRNNEKLQSAWSKWTFEGKVLNASFNTATIDDVVRPSATAAVFELRNPDTDIYGRVL